MERIAIIGMGTSGMAVAAAYAKETDSNDFAIDCYDSKDSFGRGYPYRDDSKEIILNLKSGRISYDYEDNDDLIKWHKEKGLPVNEYTSRSTFGEYTKDRLNETINKIKANVINEVVTSVQYLPDSKTWTLTTELGSAAEYDRIHLCCGELGQCDIYKLEGKPGYYNEVYPCEVKLSGIDSDHSVCIIGAGLTAVDVAIYLLEKRDIKKLYMFSRTNVVPTVRVNPIDIDIKYISLEIIEELIKKGNGIIKFEEFDELFVKELEYQNIDYYQFIKKHMQGGVNGLKVNIAEPHDLAIVQALLPPLNMVFNRVWDSMPEEDRVNFRKKYHPFMCLNRSPLPQPSAEIIIKAAEDGILEFIEDVSFVEYGCGAYDIIKANPNGMDEVLVQTDLVVNATGLDMYMRNIEKQNSLLAHMLNKRYIAIDKYGGLILRPEDQTSVSPRYGSMENLHIHGVLASGVQYRNNSTMMIQTMAHKLIKRLYMKS